MIPDKVKRQVNIKKYKLQNTFTKKYNSKPSRYRMSLHGMLLPITPGAITFTYPGKNETVDLINGGEINQIKTPGLTEIEFDCYIPQLPYPFAVYRNNFFKPASYFLDGFEEMKKMKSPFKLKIIRKLPNKTALFDTTMKVTLEEYTIKEDAENGTDLLVSIKLKQYRNYGPQKLKKKNDSGDDGKDKGTVTGNDKRDSKTPAKTYTVKAGDSLWKIAKKQLNNANKWKSIYTLNKSTIEAAAKKNGRASSSNGYWIYPGTKLKLPK